MVSKKTGYNLPGDIPDYGAIFMSNSATKDECLQRNLFGLPAPYSHFVKHVRVGMILFLFEFEKRQLHGVFQACSDGEMDIVPHAFLKAAGRRCPSQVKVKRIWACNPLLEVEFRNAIKDNYVTGNKFSFGLSETQVRKLLHLFISKVLRPPAKHLKENSVRSSEKVRQVPASRTKAHDGQRYSSGYNNVGMNPREVFEKGYSQLDSFEMEQSKYQSTERSPNDTDGARFDGGLMRNNDFQNECYKGDGFAPPALYDYSVSQSNPNWSSLSEKALEIANSLVPITAIMSNPSYTDGVSMTVHRNNRVDPFLRDYIPLCSDDLRFTSEEYNPVYGISEKVTSSLMHQPSLSYPRSEMRDSENKISSLGNYASFSAPAPSESYGTHMGYSQKEYSRNLDGGPSSTKFSFEDVPIAFSMSRNNTNENLFSDYTVKPDGYPSTNQIELENQLRYEAAQRKAIKESFLASVASAKSEDPYKFQGPLSSVNPQNLQSYGHNFMEYEAAQPKPESFLASVASAECEDPYKFQGPLSSVNTQNLQFYGPNSMEYEAAQPKPKKESFLASVASAECEDPYKFQGPVSTVNLQNLQSYGHNSMEYDPEHYQYSDSYKKRTSVFSRLALGSKDSLPQSKATKSYDVVDDESISVDVIMKTLQSNHQHWVKPEKNLWNRKDAKKSAEVRENTEVDVNSPVSPDYDDDMDDSSAGMNQEAESIKTDPFLDFKRRSEKRKPYNADEAILKVEAVAGMKQRKRKLIRPDFSKNPLPNDSDMKNSITCESAQRDCDQSGTNLGSCKGKNFGILKAAGVDPAPGTCERTGESLVQELFLGVEKGTEAGRKKGECCSALFKEGTETGSKIEMSIPGQHSKESESETTNKLEESCPGLRNEGTETRNQCEESFPAQHNRGTETRNRVEESVPGQHKKETEIAIKPEELFPGPRNDGVEAENRSEEPFLELHKEGAATVSHFDVAFPGLQKEGTATGIKLEESFLGLHDERTETGNKIEESSQGRCKKGTETGVKFEESFQGQEKEGNGSVNKFDVPFPGQHKEEIETGNKLEESIPGLHHEGTENGCKFEDSFGGQLKEGTESVNKMDESFLGLTDEGTGPGNKVEESAPGQHQERTESRNKSDESFWGLHIEGTESVNKFEDSSLGPLEGAETENRLKPNKRKRNDKADSFLPTSQSVNETHESNSVRARTDEIKSSSDQASEAQEIRYEATPKRRKLKRQR